MKLESPVEEFLGASNYDEILQALSYRPVERLVDEYGARIVVGRDVIWPSRTSAELIVESPARLRVSTVSEGNATTFIVCFDVGRALGLEYGCAAHYTDYYLEKAFEGAVRNLREVLAKERALARILEDNGDVKRSKEVEGEILRIEETLRAIEMAEAREELRAALRAAEARGEGEPLPA